MQPEGDGDERAEYARAPPPLPSVLAPGSPLGSAHDAAFCFRIESNRPAASAGLVTS